MVTRADQLADGYYGTVYHEYFHYLVHSTRLEVPLWINEGLASYWGSTRLTKKAAEVGRPDVARLDVFEVQYLDDQLRHLGLLGGLRHQPVRLRSITGELS